MKAAPACHLLATSKVEAAETCQGGIFTWAAAAHSHKATLAPQPSPTRRCVLISLPGELGRSARLPAPRLVADRCSFDDRPQLPLV